MNPSSLAQTIGNVCAVIATTIFLLPLQRLLSDYARKVMPRWVDRIPAPNYTTKHNLKRLHRWGAAMFPVRAQNFAGTGVDFAPVIADFQEHFSP